MISRPTHAAVVGTSNPFATRFIRAGERPYCFGGNEGPHRILNCLHRSRWRGQIVGPHGSGKTTLLRTLAGHWSSFERTSVVVELHNSQRSLTHTLHVTPNTQIVIDGFEQLGILSQLAIVARSMRSGCGLLVTAHRPLPWLRTVYRTATDEKLALDLANDLLQRAEDRHRNLFHVEPTNNWKLDRERLARHFDDCDGNLREVFLRLYDDYSAGCISSRMR